MDAIICIQSGFLIEAKIDEKTGLGDEKGFEVKGVRYKIRAHPMKIDDPKIWILIGFLGQFCFSCRFLVQWIASEKQKKSVIPIAFWYFSIAGALVLFTYALYRRDPVFITGQLFGVLIYLRNLHLIHKHKKSEITPA